ncbi:radical SAM family heme chaperone HemW [Petrachloros mirabilis]
MTNPIGLYLHIPFCRQRCDFCAFYLELYRQGAADIFLQALRTEIRLHAAQERINGRAFQSVYFGGGTPTTLRAGQLTDILADIRQYLPLTPQCEITVEAQPGTVSQSDLSTLFDAGINRMSFGAESMQDEELVGIGRPALAREIVEAVLWAREAGFTNINLDLMYGLPDQTLQSWKDTIGQCLELAPEHFSCYALTVEEGTRLAHDIRHHRVQAPDDSIQVAMDQTAQSMLNDAGYQQYEISNYAKPGFACRHNLLYWTHGDYLGLGPSAQSLVNGVRFGNVANLTSYQTALAQQTLPTQDESVLTKEEQLRDAVIFGLRLVQGIPTQQLRDHALNYGHATTVEMLRGQKLIEEEGERSRLSAQGRLHADTVAEKLY